MQPAHGTRYTIGNRGTSRSFNSSGNSVMVLHLLMLLKLLIQLIFKLDGTAYSVNDWVEFRLSSASVRGHWLMGITHSLPSDD